MEGPWIIPNNLHEQAQLSVKLVERKREKRDQEREEREREREREKRREERNGDRRKSKRGNFSRPVDFVAARCKFFYKLQPFVAFEFESLDDEKIWNGFGRISLWKSFNPRHPTKILKVESPTKIDCLHRRRCSQWRCWCPCGIAPWEKWNRCARMEQRCSYSLLKIELWALPHITSYTVFHLPNETEIQKSQQGMLAHFFFLMPLNLSVTKSSASVDHGWKRTPDDATKPTPFTPFFVFFF